MRHGSSLYIDSVARSFGGHRVLSGVHLQCKVGEIVGLLGRNGSGKSTLLKIVFGSQRVDHKHIKLNGELLRGKGYATGEIAYLPQDFFLPKQLKISFLIDLYANKYRQELLAIPVIKDNLKRKLKDLSGGNRRLVEGLLIVYSDATFVLLDEPFSQVAPLLIEQLQEHIRRFSPLKGFIVTDHYYGRILEISSRVILIHNGCNYRVDGEDDLVTHGYLPPSK